MKITRRYKIEGYNFAYDAKCEFCGYTHKGDKGSDSTNVFWTFYLPNMKCGKCGKSTVSNKVGNEIEEKKEMLDQAIANYLKENLSLTINVVNELGEDSDHIEVTTWLNGEEIDKASCSLPKRSNY